MLLLSQSTGLLRTIILGSVVAIAPLLIPSVGLAQNQSDVTGPNLSDVTGPNLSDVTGPNLSDNTGTNQSDNSGLLGEEIFRDANGDFVSLADFFQDFFDTYGEEFGLDPDASLADNLQRVNQTCSDQLNGNIRRFARNPGSGGPSISPACTEFSRLIQSAKKSINDYKQASQPASPVEQRLW